MSKHTAELANLRHSQRTIGSRYLLARLDGEPAGCGFIGVFPGNDPAFPSADVSVVPSFRGRGVGTALAQEISALGRELGGAGLQGEVREDDDASIGFVERRGFTEIERQKEVALDLTRIEPREVDVPAGVTIVSRAQGPDLERAEYELGRAAGRDIPGLDGSMEATFEAWRAFAVERPGVDPELCFLALAGEEVVGSAGIVVLGGTAYHNLTAVAREWRGRGIAEALKRSQIAAALARGHSRLVTESHQDNVPMRRLNEKLGYQSKPGMIVYRGPFLV